MSLWRKIHEHAVLWRPDEEGGSSASGGTGGCEFLMRILRTVLKFSVRLACVLSCLSSSKEGLKALIAFSILLPDFGTLQ